MLNDFSQRQILELSAQGANCEEISTTLGCELEMVKLVLNRNQVGSAADRDIDDEQLNRLRSHAMNLALQTEDLSVSAKMTRFLIERDKPRAVQPQQATPIVQINQAILAAQDSFKKLTASYFTTPNQVIENPGQ
jgi:hypothetical protein